MDGGGHKETISPGRGVSRRAGTERRSSAQKLYVGADIGSTSSDVVVLDEAGARVFESYRRTLGRPVQSLHKQLDEIVNKFDSSAVQLIAITGESGRGIAALLQRRGCNLSVTFVNEVVAQAAGIYHLYPDLERGTVVEMGGQDSKLIFLQSKDGQGQIREFSLNTVCAAGTGSFLDQQADRLGVSIEEEFGRLALQSKDPPRVAGRCSVFAKTDMIHLQQQATPVHDIVAGLCVGLARNLKSNLGCGREFIRPLIFTGGVAANIGVVRALERVLELEEDQLVVPDEHFFTGAIGAALKAKARGSETAGSPGALTELCEKLKSEAGSLEKAPRLEPLARPQLPPPESRVYRELLEEATEPIPAYLGVDVGSISTNVAVIDKERRVLAKAYLMTASRPLEAVKKGLSMVADEIEGKVEILAAATTGSGRYLTGDFIGADVVINEITAQATGAAVVNPKVDTIFEIGGQDSKYISLSNGVVVDFEMNHACAAGTGSFLEEQAHRLDINIKDEFAELAFKSKSPIKLGERCTVFMESDLLTFLQQGANTEELVSGLSYSIVTNYLNRVVGRRRIGDNICFQGGTAYNKAVWAAFEKVTGKPIMVPDHHEVTGAIGAAVIAARHMEKQPAGTGSTFKGVERLTQIEYHVETFTCEHCPNHCEVKKVEMPGSEPLYYGSRCDRYNLKQRKRRESRFAGFEYREQKLFEYAGLKQRPASGGGPKVGIPLALSSWQMLPLFSRFLQEVGCEVVVSNKTTKKTIRRGVELVAAQTCFPVKVAYGHVEELIEKGCDYIFLPSVVSMPLAYEGVKTSHFCPYVQTLPYQIKATLGSRLGRCRLLSPPIRLGEGRRLLRKTLTKTAGELGRSGGQVRRAIDRALAAQDGFQESLRERGRQILSELGEDERLFVLVSRPYNGCDTGMNLQLPKKLGELGAEAIPMDMLDLPGAELTDRQLHNHTYWKYGQDILRAAEIVRRDPRLYAVYLSNFSCGPDSFLLSFFSNIMAGKPSLCLEIDEHSADAGVITRLEAYFESLRHYRPVARERAEEKPACSLAQGYAMDKQRKLYIPWMGDASYSLAACFRGHGQSAEVLPMADEITLLHGRQCTLGKECLPCTITAGDMVKVLKDERTDPSRCAFFMPSGAGPCRFGMYHCLHQLILRDLGVDDVPMIAPNQDSDLYNEFRTKINFGGSPRFTKDAWHACAGADLLGKVIRRIRPYATDRRTAQAAYDEAFRRWNQAVEKLAGLRELRKVMAELAGLFEQVELDYSVRKPRIGIVGEIYVRSHDFANQFLIERLEKLGAACDLAPFAEWIYYTNWTRLEKARRHRRPRRWISNFIEDVYQRKTEKMLARPLEAVVGPLAEERVKHVLDLAEPYIHRSFEGETVLSVGKALEYYEQGFGGVVNVMPFTCMPSTIVSTQTPKISDDCNGLPLLNISFDGQSDPTLNTRLEAFVEHVRQRDVGSRTAAEVLAAES